MRGSFSSPGFASSAFTVIGALSGVRIGFESVVPSLAADPSGHGRWHARNGERRPVRRRPTEDGPADKARLRRPYRAGRRGKLVSASRLLVPVDGRLG